MMSSSTDAPRVLPSAVRRAVPFNPTDRRLRLVSRRHVQAPVVAWSTAASPRPGTPSIGPCAWQRRLGPRAPPTLRLTNIEAIGVASRAAAGNATSLVYQIDGHCKRQRKAKTLEGFFDWFGAARSAALYVCSDMWNSPPRPEVVAEPASRAGARPLEPFQSRSDEVRAAEARKLGRGAGAGAQAQPLAFRPEKLTGEQRGRLAELVRRTVRAYLLKEDFQSLWGYVRRTGRGSSSTAGAPGRWRGSTRPHGALAPRPDSDHGSEPGGSSPGVAKASTERPE